MKSTKKAAIATTAATIAVFAKTQNVVDAIIIKADLDPSAVHVILADDSNPDAYKEMASFPGNVFSTQLQDQRLGKAQTKIPLFPKGVKTPTFGNSALAKAMAATAKSKNWDLLRDPKTAPEVLVANMGDPVKVIGVELNDSTAAAFDIIKDLIESTLKQASETATGKDQAKAAQDGTEAFEVLLNMLGA